MTAQNEHWEANPSFSRDGKWIVYVSNESGTDEVYVLSLDGGGGKVQISSDRGTFPRWRRDGREIRQRKGVHHSPAGSIGDDAVAVQASERAVHDCGDGSGI